MAFRLSMKSLALFSRQLGVMLGAGISIRRALATMERNARAPLNSTCHGITFDLESGRTFSEALKRRGRAFPVLFLRLAHVGEAVGGLEHVLTRLADYYDFLRSLWQRLLTNLIWPLFEYWALIFVLAILAYVRGLIANDPNPGHGALRILALGLVIFLTPIVLYFVFTRVFGGLRIVHEVMIRIPVIGSIVRTMAIARFSWAMELMTAGGVRILDAIVWSLEATTNGAFEGRAPAVVSAVESGEPLHEALRRTGLFPYDYIEMIHVAGESGSMPDIFARLARQYFEKMDTALKVLGQAMFWLIWIVVAAVIIYYILTMGMAYFSTINELTRSI